MITENNKDKLFCGKCNSYTKHDSMFGYCRRYREQRKYDDNCITNETWWED